MLFRDLGIADLKPAATRRIDQRPRLVAGRILEGRAARPTPEGLRFFASTGDRVHLGADRLGLARRAAKSRFDHDRAFGHVAVAIGVTELLERPFNQLARTQDEPRGNQDVADLTTISPAVHPNKAADGAGNAAQEFQPGDAAIARTR